MLGREQENEAFINEGARFSFTLKNCPQVNVLIMKDSVKIIKEGYL